MELLRAVRSSIAIGVALRRFEDDYIACVHHAVGESPRNAAVAASDNGRRARQGHAGDIEGGIFRLQPRSVPDVGFAEAQVHVVFDYSRASCAERTADGETIAAWNGGRFIDSVCRRGVFCALQSLRGKRRRRQKRPVHRSVETRALGE